MRFLRIERTLPKSLSLITGATHQSVTNIDGPTSLLGPDVWGKELWCTRFYMLLVSGTNKAELTETTTSKFILTTFSMVFLLIFSTWIIILFKILIATTLYKYWLPERVTWEIVTPRKPMSTVDIGFRGVTISHVTLSGSQFLLYHIEC